MKQLKIELSCFQGLRRAGRFDQEIPIGIPDEKQRKRILEILCCKLRKSEDFDLEKIVINTPGYVGADLNALIDEALISALDRRLNDQISKQNQDSILSLIQSIKAKLDSFKALKTTETSDALKPNGQEQTLVIKV